MFSNWYNQTNYTKLFLVNTYYILWTIVYKALFSSIWSYQLLRLQEFTNEHNYWFYQLL
jgi:hypothetical protein